MCHAPKNASCHEINVYSMQIVVSAMKKNKGVRGRNVCVCVCVFIILNREGFQGSFTETK